MATTIAPAVELMLIRFRLSQKSTIGKLFVNNEFLCYTIEDTDRMLENFGASAKIQNETAIPLGNYKVVLSHSNRFGRVMPEVLGVPFFTGIRIHSGNTAEDTEGCVLVGNRHSGEAVLDSVAAYKRLFPILEHAYKANAPLNLVIARYPLSKAI